MERTRGGAARSTVDAGGPVPANLRLPPAVDLQLVVEHSAADTDAGGTDANVTPVADGGWAGPKASCDFFGGEQADGHGHSLVAVEADRQTLRRPVHHKALIKADC